MYVIFWKFGRNTKREIVLNSIQGTTNNGFVSESQPITDPKEITTPHDGLSDAIGNDDLQGNANGRTILDRSENDGAKNVTIEIHSIETIEFKVEEEVGADVDANVNLDRITKNDCIECKENTIENGCVQPTYSVHVIENKHTQRGQFDVNKFDEISSADDIKQSCIEKREPNGTTYFVEINSNAQTHNNNNSSNGIQILSECSSLDAYGMANEKNIIEEVLQQQSIVKPLKHDSNSELSIHDADASATMNLFDESDVEDEKEVKAVVHVSDPNISIIEEDSNDKKIAPNELESKSTIEADLNENENKITKPGTIKAFGAHKCANFRIGEYEAIPKRKLLFENDSDRMAFKMRLENLIGSNDTKNVETLKRPHSRINSPTSRVIGPQLNYSNSAPESLVLSNHVNDDVLQLTKPVLVPAPTTPVQPCKSDAPEVDETAEKIPIPPTFNQQLYDTVGRRNKSLIRTVLSTPAVIDTEHEPKSEPDNKKVTLSRSNAHENLTMIDVGQSDSIASEENGSSTAAIKRKLEEIFSRGRTETSDVDFILGSDTIESSNDNVPRTKPETPFDTVKRQKMLFSTVLKSIGPDFHSNLRRTSSVKSNDIGAVQRRDSVD